MSKADIVAAALSAISAGSAQVLSDAVGAAVDQSALEQKASDGTLGQGDLDAAVAAAVAPLNEQILALTDKDAADIAAGVAALSDLQGKLDTLAAKESVEAGIVNGLKDSLAALQDVVAKLSGIVTPPVPADPAV